MAPSDFIFAMICEEMGFFGAAIVIVLFAVIVWQGACIVASCRDDFGKLAGLGIALTVGLQAAMNIAVVTVMVPTKGISPAPGLGRRHQPDRDRRRRGPARQHRPPQRGGPDQPMGIDVFL